MPVAEAFNDYLFDVADKLRRRGVRVEVDTSDDRFGKKIRNASKDRIPFTLIAGGDDAEAGAVSFHMRDGSQDNGIAVDDAIERIVAAIEAHENSRNLGLESIGSNRAFSRWSSAYHSALQAVLQLLVRLGSHLMS